MNKKLVIKSLIPIVSVLLMITLLFHYDSETRAAGHNSGEFKRITVYQPLITGSGPVIVTYPEAPSPGDFFLLEASPVGGMTDPLIKFDFPGTQAKQYIAGEILYIIIAVDLETTPGFYSIGLYDAEDDNALYRIDDFEISGKDFRFSRFSMPPDRTAGWTAARLAEDREKVRQAREMTEPYPLWLHRFVNPLEGRITSEFGAIRVINDAPPRRHNGIDIGAEEGTPIFSPNCGIVRLAEFLLSGGNTVIIDHGLDLSSTYMHLEEMAVEKGDFINRGEVIGTVGMTGYATGPHLHWEVSLGQTPINPQQLLDNDLIYIAPAYFNLFVP